MKKNNKYLMFFIISIVLVILVIGVGCYFIFTRDSKGNNDNFSQLELEINGNKEIYNCNSTLCREISSDYRNYIFLKDDNYGIFDMENSTVINVPISKNYNVTDAMIVSKDNAVLGLFYTVDEKKYNLYSFLENREFSLNYEYGYDFINPYSLVKDGYYVSSIGVIRYKDNKIMLKVDDNYAGINSLECHESIDGNSYYFTYNQDESEKTEVFSRNFKMIGNDEIGYKFYSYGLNNNNDFIVETSEGKIFVVDENGKVIKTNNYDFVYDGYNGYLLVNNNNKLQLVYSDGTIIKDFTEKVKKIDINHLTMGNMDDTATGPLSETGDSLVVFQFMYIYEDFSSDLDYIQYEIIHNIETRETSFREIPVNITN